MKSIWMVVITLTLMAGCAGQGAKIDGSAGYLTQNQYDLLQEYESASGATVYRYISPSFKAANYNSAVVVPVVTHPEPQATEQVSLATINTLQTKMTALVSDSLKAVLPLATEPGQGVLKFETAITGVDISNTNLKVYQYIPVALVINSVKTVAGGRDQKVRLNIEMKVSDSLTGDVLVVAVRQIAGEDLENVKTKLDANQLNKGLATAGKDMVSSLKSVFK